MPIPRTAEPCAALGMEDFRQRLAGVASAAREPSPDERQGLRHESASWIVVLCRLFGESLDRKTLWSRIATALATAHAKAPEDDLDRWCDLCLDHVRADPGYATANEEHLAWRGMASTRDLTWRLAFRRYVSDNPYAVLAFGREAWEAHKEARSNG